MKVLLLVEIPKVGHKGEIVDVSEGYAKNLLLRKKMAVVATSQIISEYEQRKEKEDRIKEEKIKEISLLAKKLLEQTFQFYLKTGKNGEIFSSVHADEICDAVFQKVKDSGSHALERSDVSCDTKPIKTLGEHPVELRIGRGENTHRIGMMINVLGK